MQCPTILEIVFRHFCQENETMNYEQFVTFARECKLLDKDLRRADTSAAFAECVANSTDKRMTFAGFKQNLTIMANNKSLTKNDATKKVESYGKRLLFVNYSRGSIGSFSGLSSPKGSSSFVNSKSTFESVSEM